MKAQLQQVSKIQYFNSEEGAPGDIRRGFFIEGWPGMISKKN